MCLLVLIILRALMIRRLYFASYGIFCFTMVLCNDSRDPLWLNVAMMLTPNCLPDHQEQCKEALATAVVLKSGCVLASPGDFKKILMSEAHTSVS